MKVLVADDDALSRTVIQRAVERDGHYCLLARDGAAAWALFRQEGADVLITDWAMPHLDGRALCRLVRTRAALADAYVYVLFVSGYAVSRRVVLSDGADDYLAKPLDPRDLRLRLAVAERVVHVHTVLQARALDAERLTAERERFAAELIHDVRSPLSASSNAAEYLATRGVLSAEDQHLLAIVRSGLERAHAVLTDMARTATGDVPCRPVALGPLVAAAVQEVTHLVVLRAAHIDVGVLPTVCGHPTDLSRVFVNLLHNALCYGGAHITVRAAEEAGERQWRVSVHDSGEGLDLDELERIFAPFARGRRSRDTLPSGSGLGLSICRRLVERAGGRIWAEGAPGAGTSIVLSLPATENGG